MQQLKNEYLRAPLFIAIYNCHGSKTTLCSPELQKKR